MRQLILVRHAKSDRDAPGFSDLERPLAARGRRDAPAMAARLHARLPELDALYSSPAARARETAAAFAAAYGLAAAEIRDAPGFYTFSGPELLAALRELLDDACGRVAAFGHNPAMSAAVAALSGRPLEFLPTCMVARFAVHAERWRELAPERCELQELDTPKHPA